VAASIRFQSVIKRYPGTAAGAPPALDGANFDIEPGAFVYLTGPSGAGKSTVFRLIAAIERPSGGVVLVNQQNVGALSRASVPYLRRNLGLVLQDAHLLADRSVFDNVLLPLAVAGVEPREAGRRVRAALDKVGMADRELALPASLSGGEQQRVCIARAVVARPSLLLADEPTANLDAANADRVLELFAAFHAVGVTVLLATHDEALMARHPGRRLALDRGRVVSAEAAA
jgi:cell division transport system ATP-binding protein